MVRLKLEHIDKGLNSVATLRGTENDDVIKQNKNLKVTIYGLGGDDQIHLDFAGRGAGFNHVDAGSGNDTVRNSFEGGNNIFLGDGNDIYLAKITAGRAIEYDIVKGGNGNDVFVIETDHSKYYGEAGNDKFFSSGILVESEYGLHNYFNGGSGADTISYEVQTAYEQMLGVGMMIDLGEQRAWTIEGHHETLISIENATGTETGGDDITGTSVRNILKGLGGNDGLYGLGGADALSGGGGKDELFGGAGDDQLSGGSDADFLRGGTGSDILTGGTGKDVFDFNSISDSVTGSRRDVIADFLSKQDIIDLQSIDANKWVSGDQSFIFIGGQSFHGIDGELRFSKGILAGDIDGDGRSDFHIKLDGITKMYASDFIL